MKDEAIEGREQRIPERRMHALSVFENRDFRLLWAGQFFGRMGTWLQFTSLTYLLGVILSHSEAQSSLYLGFLGAAQMVPALLLGPIGGYAADRYSRRTILMVVAVTRSVMGVAFAIVAHQSGAWVIFVALLCAGTLAGVDSFDSPARQSWLVQIVPRQVLSSATGLISIGNNLPMMVGPAIAGVLIGTVGVYASFVLTALSQLVVLGLLFFMRPPPVATRSEAPMLNQIAAGLRFIASHPVLRWLFLLTSIVSLFVRPYGLLLATFAGLVLNVDAKAYGLMLAAGGVGTVGGAIVTAVWRSDRRSWLWFTTGLMCSAGVLGLGYIHNFNVALLVLTLIALGYMTFSSALFITLQLLCPEEIRGRAVATYTMIIFGFVPGGGLLMGSFAAVTSLPVAYAVGGAIGFAAIVWVWLAKPALRAS